MDKEQLELGQIERVLVKFQDFLDDTKKHPDLFDKDGIQTISKYQKLINQRLNNIFTSDKGGENE